MANDQDGVTNIVEGEIGGDLIQVGNLGEGDGSRPVTNMVAGRVMGDVIQAGDLQGNINF